MLQVGAKLLWDYHWPEGTVTAEDTISLFGLYLISQDFGFIQGLDGVEQIKDDLVVHGKGKIHDERLKALFIRLKEYGITLRREKCKFGKPEVHWFGNTFNKHGMMADTEKVATVKYLW